METKYYFYILKCRNGNRYYGHTNNLVKRLREHSVGKVKSTKYKRPVELIYYEECKLRSEAYKREMQFKNGRTRKSTVDRFIRSFRRAKCQGFNSQTASPTTYVRSLRSLHKSSAH